MAIALFQRRAISEVVWHFVSQGDHVFSQKYGWGTVLEKERTQSLGLPRFWLELASGVEIIEPCFVEIF